MADDVLWDKAAKWLNRIDECETGGDKVSLMCRLMGGYEKELSAVKAERDRMREALRAVLIDYHDGPDDPMSYYAVEMSEAALATPKAEKPKCVCDHLENQHTRLSPIGALGCASCSCLAYEGKPRPTPAMPGVPHERVGCDKCLGTGLLNRSLEPYPTECDKCEGHGEIFRKPKDTEAGT